MLLFSTFFATVTSLVILLCGCKCMFLAGTTFASGCINWFARAGRIVVDMFQCFVRLEDDEGGLLDTVDDIDGVGAVHGFEDR